MLRPDIIEAVLSTTPSVPPPPAPLTVNPLVLGIHQRAPVGRIPATYARPRGVPTRLSLKETLNFLVRTGRVHLQPKVPVLEKATGTRTVLDEIRKQAKDTEFYYKIARNQPESYKRTIEKKSTE
jgi:hypothetical protein